MKFMAWHDDHKFLRGRLAMAYAAEAFDLEDLAVGQHAEFETVIADGDIDRFATLSGDKSPLHVDKVFARTRGYADRVAHGAYLVALASRLVGMYLPGRNALLLAAQVSVRGAGPSRRARQGPRRDRAACRIVYDRLYSGLYS